MSRIFDRLRDTWNREVKEPLENYLMNAFRYEAYLNGELVAVTRVNGEVIYIPKSVLEPKLSS